MFCSGTYPLKGIDARRNNGFVLHVQQQKVATVASEIGSIKSSLLLRSSNRIIVNEVFE